VKFMDLQQILKDNMWTYVIWNAHFDGHSRLFIKSMDL